MKNTWPTQKLGEVDKLKNFINGIGAVRQLLGRAHTQDFLLEALVLYAAVIDGLCRMALLLAEQIEKKTSKINEQYIFQNESSKSYLTERNIYNLASDKKILEKDLFDELSALYEVRNKAIHRFLLSQIEYSHLELTLDRYELAFQRLWTVVYNLESEQITKKVGMTISGKASKKDENAIRKQIFTKIKTGNVESLKHVLGTKLIKNHDEFSEADERERISDEIADELEIQKEKKAIPSGFTSVKEVTKWAERRGLFEKCQCEHEKVHHIHLDKSKAKDELVDNPDSCKIASCTCVKYVKRET